jgi:DNA-binding NtrC family response regulator
MTLLTARDERDFKKQWAGYQAAIDLSDPSRLIRPLAEVERQTVESALILCEGSRKLAAQRLGITRRCLQYKMRQYLRDDGEPLRHAGNKAKGVGAGGHSL